MLPPRVQVKPTAAELSQDKAPLVPLPPSEGDLWQRWRHDRDMRAREQLIGHFLPYARTIAAITYARRTHDEIEFADYFQLASVGLIEAVERFDPEQGAQFKTFAHKRMQGAILSGLERLTEKNQQIAAQQRLRRERLESIKAQSLLDGTEQGNAQTPPKGHSPEALFNYLAEVGIGLALSVLLEGTGMLDSESSGGATAVSPEVSYFRQTELRNLQQLVRGLLSRLNAQEQIVIRHHYLQEIPFDKIAAHLGVGRSRVSQLHRQALKTLRDCLAQKNSCDQLL